MNKKILETIWEPLKWIWRILVVLAFILVLKSWVILPESPGPGTLYLHENPIKLVLYSLIFLVPLGALVYFAWKKVVIRIFNYFKGSKK